MQWSIYKITCSVTGKAYIGLTKRLVSTRWQFHIYNARYNHAVTKGMIICRAIRKYGAESFAVETLSVHSNIEEASAAECAAIEAHGTLRPKGYNVAVGGYYVRGKPGRPSPENIERLASMWRGKTFPPEMRRKMSEAAKRKVFTLQHRENIGAASRGKPNRGVAIAALLRETSGGVAGAKGVRPTPEGKWMTRIKIKGLTTYVGTFATLEAASEAYRAARDKRLGELGHSPNTNCHR